MITEELDIAGVVIDTKIAELRFNIAWISGNGPKRHDTLSDQTPYVDLDTAHRRQYVSMVMFSIYDLENSEEWKETGIYNDNVTDFLLSGLSVEDYKNRKNKVRHVSTLFGI